MRISVKGEYALRAVFDLANRDPGAPVKIAAIAKRQGIPRKYLESILAELKQGGIVESRRGADGGYLLARPAEAITVGEVLRLTERGEAANDRSRPSPFAEMWRRVEEEISAVIDFTTFAELRRAWRDKQGAYVPNWEI